MKKLPPNAIQDSLVILLMITSILIIPAIPIWNIITTQQALNRECKTNYNFFQVAVAGENLSRICRMKNDD
jgi:hypothetical protein